MVTPICQGCKKTPNEIDEYREAADDHGTDPVTYVQREEGTYNPENGHFLCTTCYIKAGMPASEKGWVCP